jgi:SAM-dependent methyltransferase
MDETGRYKAAVRDTYGAAARGAAAGAGCCGSGCGCGDPVTSDLYDAKERAGLPQGAVSASLGCGNPTALADLRPGETVLDLGSGGGIDVFLSARRVGPAGKVYGLDMTDDMLALARSNQRAAGVENVEFLKGDIEAIPLPANSVDVVISNCVINLAEDKDRALAEAFRVLKPGGRFAVADVVARGPVDHAIRHDLNLWVGCVAGALSEDEYRTKLSQAGFDAVEIEPWRIDDAQAMRPLPSDSDDAGGVAAAVAPGVFASAFVRARKPAAARSCCGPECCH